MRRLMVIGLSLVLLGTTAFAADGAWQVRTRLIDVAPDGSGTNGLEGLDIKSDFTVEVDFSKFLTDRLALELIVATASQELQIEGISLGSVNHLPPTLTLQWHFMDQDAKFQPYIGAGLNATFFYGKSGAIDQLDLSTSFGLAAQLGADWKVTDKTFFNVDLKYIDISTDVETKAGDKIGTADINPLVFGVGIGWRF